TAAARNEVAQLLAWRVRQRDDVRQDESLELAEVCRIEQALVGHLEWNARLDQSLIPAQCVVFEPVADEPGRLLRVNEGHARQRRLVAQVFLPTGVATIK